MSLEIQIATLTAQLQSGAMKIDRFNAEVAKLVAAAKAAPAGLSIKSGEKGTLVVRGDGFIVGQLYASQWSALLTDENVAQVREYIATNAATLAARPPKKTKPAAAPAAQPAAAPTTITLPPGVDAAALLAHLNAAQAK